MGGEVGGGLAGSGEPGLQKCFLFYDTATTEIYTLFMSFYSILCMCLENKYVKSIQISLHLREPIFFFFFFKFQAKGIYSLKQVLGVY